MATLRTTLPDLYLQRLAFLEQVLFDEMPVEGGVFGRILRVKDMGNKPLVRTTTVASFGTVPTKAEGAAVTYEELGGGFDSTYQADTYELAFKASKEAMDDEQEEVVSDAARALGSSMTYTYDVDHANIFNDGFTATTGSPDGVILFSTVHPLAGGGTNANRPSTDEDPAGALSAEVAGDRTHWFGSPSGYRRQRDQRLQRRWAVGDLYAAPDRLQCVLPAVRAVEAQRPYLLAGTPECSP